MVKAVVIAGKTAAESGATATAMSDRAAGGASIEPADGWRSVGVAVRSNLPAMPAVLARLSEITADERADTRRVAELLASDAGLVAQVLRVVNSAYYAPAQPIADVRYAITFLGLRAVGSLVLATCVVRGLGVTDAKALGRFWHHSYYVALTARFLAGVVAPGTDPGELWSAAIVHDIGSLVLLRSCPDAHRELTDFAAAHRWRIVEAEEALDSPGHGELGGLLCDHWGLPAVIGDVCRHHHRPYETAALAGADARMLRRLVWLGDMLAELATAELGEDVRQALLQAIAGDLGLGDTELTSLMGRVLLLREAVERFMGEAV